ncbi:MAG: uracil-DNA glycosylase family protein [Anaeromyxobacter sp.]
MNPIELLQDAARSCARCQGDALLHSEPENRAYPVFQQSPPWPVRVVVVGEAPNFDDTFDPAKRRLTLEPGTDPTGAFMFDLLASVGLRPEQVVFTNSVLCLPARNAEGKHPVSARQQGLCSDWLAGFIDAANPVVVVTFGAVALQGVGRLERHGLSLGKGAGKLHPWRGRLLLPLYHPGRLGRVTRRAEQQMIDISVLRDALTPAAAPDAGLVLDAATARAVMQDHPDGARLVLRSKDGHVHRDLACAIGLSWSRTPVFAYLESGDGPPFQSETRFYVERIARRDGLWVIECRHQRGIHEVEVHPLSEAESASIQEWLGSLPGEAVQDLDATMRHMLDPRAL